LFFIGYIIFYNIKIRDRILGWRNAGSKKLGNKETALIGFAVYSVAGIIFTGLLKSLVAALSVALLPVIGIISVIDITGKKLEDREMRQITFFLMTMAKWSGVKNDLVYCLKKTNETNMKKPVGSMVKITLGRIYGGMTPAAAFGLVEKEAHSEDMRYLVKNIRFAAEKGGNLQKLFKGMEEQYFKIDEEYFKRKISTLRDRIAVYLTIFMVAATGIWFIWNNPVAKTFYIHNPNGNLLLMVFVIIFGTGVMVMMKR
jgi:Flp pilus assembly protein TadB